MWDANQLQLLEEASAIKWALICIAVSMWGLTVYFFLKELPKWWKSFEKKKKNTKGFNIKK